MGMPLLAPKPIKTRHVKPTPTQKHDLRLFVKCGDLASPSAPRAIRLQQMRQSVDETQLAVLDSEEVGIWRTAASGGGASAECAEGHHSSNRLVNDEVPVRDVDAARHANLTGIVRGSPAGVH